LSTEVVMRMQRVVVIVLAAAAVADAALAAPRPAEEPSFAHPRDIGPRYEPDIDRWWEDYRRTGCMPVPHAVRLPNGRYVVRTTRDCGGTPASRSGM
jgi:hypothetical protein